MLQRCLKELSSSKGLLPVIIQATSVSQRLHHTDPNKNDWSSLESSEAEFREVVREFAAQVIAPHASAIDAENSFPKAVNLWRAIGNLGLHGKTLWDLCPTSQTTVASYDVAVN